MFSERNEGTAEMLGAALFLIIGLVQLWRAATVTAVVIGAHAVPIWLSIVFAVIALFMAAWLFGYARGHRARA